MNNAELEMAQFLFDTATRASELAVRAEASQATALTNDLDRITRLISDTFLFWTGRSVLECQSRTELALDAAADPWKSLNPRQRIRD